LPEAVSPGCETWNWFTLMTNSWYLGYVICADCSCIKGNLEVEKTGIAAEL